MSHYPFAAIATRLLAVAFDTTGKVWIIRRELVAGDLQDTLVSNHATDGTFTDLELVASVPAGHAGFGTAQLAGWPVNYEDPYLVTLGGEPGLGAKDELPDHPHARHVETPRRLTDVTVKFTYRPGTTALPAVCQVTFAQADFSQATFDLTKLLKDGVLNNALWFVLRLSGNSQGTFAFQNGAKFSGKLSDAAGKETEFKDASVFSVG